MRHVLGFMAGLFAYVVVGWVLLALLSPLNSSAKAGVGMVVLAVFVLTWRYVAKRVTWGLRRA